MPPPPLSHWTRLQFLRADTLEGRANVAKVTLATLGLVVFCWKKLLLKEGDKNLDGCKVSHGGHEYRGSVSVTQTGRRCKFWDSLGADYHKVVGNLSDRDFPEGSLRKARNFCRNPSGAPEGPWCVTWDPDVVTDVCAVPLCRSTECRRTGPGAEFAGRLSQEDCSRWPSSFPASRFPEGSRAAAGRSCRNPDGDVGGPWCPLEDAAPARSYCHVPFCDGPTRCLTYSASDGDPAHYTRLPEGGAGNLTLRLKLWDPAAWKTARLGVTLSRTVHLDEDSVRLDLASALRAEKGGGASLSGVRWTSVWVAWEESSVYLGHEASTLTTAPLSRGDPAYYGVSGAGVLWAPAACGDTCTEHVTTGATFPHFRELEGDGGGGALEARAWVRAAGPSVSVELRVAPGLRAPSYRVTLRRDNVTTVSYRGDAGTPSTTLLTHHGAAPSWDYWRWREVSLSVTRDVLHVADVTVTVAHPQLRHVRWFSVGSRLSTAHWSLGCKLPEPPRAAPPECSLGGVGGGYSGTQWVTSLGLACLPWTHPAARAAGLSAAHSNYCRNPDASPGGPWCYVLVGVDGDVRRDYCHVRACQSLECRMSGTANDYMGQLNRTRSNRTCASWAAPSRGYLNSSLFPERSVRLARNYCRNPTRSVAGTWCYTTDDDRAPRDLCSVPDCEEREACVALTRGSSEGRMILVQPRWRSQRGALNFALKEWDPDLRDAIVWHLTPGPGSDGRSLRLEMHLERVRLYLLERGQQLLLREKELADLIPVGRWGRFWLRLGRERLSLGHEGVARPLLAWPSPLEPLYVGYASLEGHAVGVAFPCSDCHAELTSTRLFTKILPVSLWKPAAGSSLRELTLHVRGRGAAQVALMLLPGEGDYHAVTLGDGDHGDHMYWLRQRAGTLQVLGAARLPFPVISEGRWTRFVLRWSQDVMRVYREERLFLRERSPEPLLLYFFSVGGAGPLLWVANCDPPDVDAPRVDGGWSRWAASTPCSASCGGGYQLSTRLCNSPPPTLHGSDCEGTDTREDVCNPQPCGVLAPDTVDQLRDEARRRHFVLEAARGANVSLRCGDSLAMQRVFREAPDSRLRWAKDGRALAPALNTTNITVSATESGVYTCSLLHGGPEHTVLLPLRTTAVAVRESVSVRATTSLQLECHGLVLGLLYDHLSLRWELDGHVWRDYGVVVPAAVERTRIESVAASHQGTWRCLLEQKDLGFLWVTSWITLTVRPAPSFLSHLMEDPLPGLVFGRFSDETHVLLALVCLGCGFVALVAALTALYLRFCRLP